MQGALYFRSASRQACWHVPELDVCVCYHIATEVMPVTPSVTFAPLHFYSLSFVNLRAKLPLAKQRKPTLPSLLWALPVEARLQLTAESCRKREVKKLPKLLRFLTNMRLPV